jgi:hypothetical protein
MPHVNLDVTDSTGHFGLSGPQSIVGRSVVVHSSVDGSNFECGTIQLVEQTDATGMKVPVLGTIWVRVPLNKHVHVHVHVYPSAYTRVHAYVYVLAGISLLLTLIFRKHLKVT